MEQGSEMAARAGLQHASKENGNACRQVGLHTIRLLKTTT
jgi:hypothetical protein